MMNPRFNHNHPFPGSTLPDPHAPRTEPRRPAISSKPKSPRPAQSPFAQPANYATDPEPDQEPRLENEIPVAELNGFALCCIEQLSISKKNQPAEKTITTSISEKLPGYTSLKAEYSSCRQSHRRHHQWTKQVYDAVEPLLKLEGAPLGEQQKLSDLALQYVEQNLQLQYRVEQLRIRVAFLEDAVPEHLIQVGLEIGLPSDLMRKMGGLVKTLMQRHA